MKKSSENERERDYFSLIWLNKIQKLPITIKCENKTNFIAGKIPFELI